MKLFIFVSLILSAVVSASSAKRALSHDVRPFVVKPEGAIYFMTNAESGNFVIVANVAADGTLTWSKAVSTYGIGQIGNVSPRTPDALFSQGSVVVSEATNVLLVVNAGSDTLSIFSINSCDPSDISLLGTPVPTGGEFPVSAAINSNGTLACVLNGGEVNGVSCFKINPKTGLVPIRNSFRSLGLTQTTPATGNPGSVSHIIFQEKGNSTQLIAAVKGNTTEPGFLAIWDVDADGELSQQYTAVPPPKGGSLMFSLTPIPGTEALLASDAGLGFEIIDLSGPKSSLATAGSRSTSSAVAIAGEMGICWSQYSKQTGSFYLIDTALSIVNEVRVDENLRGTLLRQYHADNTRSALLDAAVLTVGGQEYLFVLGARSTSVNVLALNTPGNASTVGIFNFTEVANAAGVEINLFNLQGLAAINKRS